MKIADLNKNTIVEIGNDFSCQKCVRSYFMNGWNKLTELLTLL